MNKEIYTDFNDIKTKIANLKEIGKSDDGWTFFYKDENEQKWELNYYESDFTKHGVQILKKSRIFSIDELITIVTSSNSKDEIIGASIDLYFKEFNNREDFREKLLNKLNEFDLKDLSDFDKERLKIIIYESNLYDPLNRREIIGVSKQKVDSDARYFREIAQKAKEILEKIK